MMNKPNGVRFSQAFNMLLPVIYGRFLVAGNVVDDVAKGATLASGLRAK
jgi:hypothetical protein